MTHTSPPSKIPLLSAIVADARTPLSPMPHLNAVLSEATDADQPAETRTGRPEAAGHAALDAATKRVAAASDGLKHAVADGPEPSTTNERSPSALERLPASAGDADFEEGSRPGNHLEQPVGKPKSAVIETHIPPVPSSTATAKTEVKAALQPSDLGEDDKEQGPQPIDRAEKGSDPRSSQGQQRHRAGLQVEVPNTHSSEIIGRTPQDIVNMTMQRTPQHDGCATIPVEDPGRLPMKKAEARQACRPASAIEAMKDSSSSPPATVVSELPATHSAFQARTVGVENERAGEHAGGPDVLIGHVDVTVISTDVAPVKPVAFDAPRARGASLTSLHYLRRF